MRPLSARATVLILAGLVILGGVIGMLDWRTWQAHRAIQRGPKVEAVVVERGECPAWRSCSTKYSTLASVTVRFRGDDGKSHDANVVSREEYPPGSRLLIRYDPAHPERAEQVGFDLRFPLTLLIGGLMVFGGLVGLAPVLWRTARGRGALR